MPFNPTLSRSRLKKEFSKLQKLNYNQFRWWRMYESKNKPLKATASFRDTILNGDYDFSHYWYQAAWVEHDIDDLEIECADDAGKFVEKASILRSRRTRLLEDYERDESDKLNRLEKEFIGNFVITEDQIRKEMVEWSGDLINFYYHIEDNYQKLNIPSYGKKKRGRPRKIT
tara:strand:+ start:2265 stop:2780 length:516 start_codon:yes stop_codon:yes gene_type:complete